MMSCDADDDLRVGLVIVEMLSNFGEGLPPVINGDDFGLNPSNESRNLISDTLWLFSIVGSELCIT